jgi:putative heme-binding domain-containing protein
VLGAMMKAVAAPSRFLDRVVEERVRDGDKTIDHMAYWVFQDRDAQHIMTWIRAIRVATRIDSPKARKFVRDSIAEINVVDFEAVRDPLRQAAIHSMGLCRDMEAVPILTKLLEDKNLITRRMAAEALGRIGVARAVEQILMSLANNDNDRSLDHALTYALIELDNREYLKNSLDNESPRVRRACLTALDQLGEKLDPKVVLDAMKSSDPALRETAQWIAGRHPEWAPQLIDYFADRLAEPKGDDLVPQLAKFASTPRIQQLLAGVVANAEVSDQSRTTAMKAMAAAGLKTPPDSWYTALESPLDFVETKQTKLLALTTLRSLPAPKNPPKTLIKKLQEVSRESTDRELIIGSLAAIPGGPPKLEAGEFNVLMSCVERDVIPELRGLAADVLSRSKLEAAQLKAIIENLSTVGPLEFDRVLAAFAQSKDDEIGKKLIAALSTPEVRPALRVDMVKERIKNFSPVVHKEAEKLYAELNKDYEQQRAKLDEAVRTLKPGDIIRGQAIFNSTKTSCIACHTVGYVGGKQGPDLTKIGNIRTERDLLESILFPSASFVRSYETVIVSTKDQKTFSGIPKKDSPDEMILVIAADKEVRIPREEIEEVRPGKVSIMPDGLDKQLTPQELADLIAFLKSRK